MTDPLLPKVLTVATAAALAGRNVFRVRQMLRDGTLDAPPQTGRSYVSTVSLEAYLGRAISPAEYLKAERSRDAALAALRQYNSTRHRPGERQGHGPAAIA